MLPLRERPLKRPPLIETDPTQFTTEQLLLWSVMQKYELTRGTTAAILGVSENTMDAYLLKKDSKHMRNISKETVAMLEAYCRVHHGVKK